MPHTTTHNAASNPPHPMTDTPTDPREVARRILALEAAHARADSHEEQNIRVFDLAVTLANHYARMPEGAAELLFEAVSDLRLKCWGDTSEVAKLADLRLWLASTEAGR